MPEEKRGVPILGVDIWEHVGLAQKHTKKQTAKQTCATLPPPWIKAGIKNSTQ